MLSVSGKRSSDAWHGCTDVTAISPTMTSNCGAGYCKRGTTHAASCHRGGERTRDYFSNQKMSNFPEVLPYSHRWHTVLSPSITSELDSDNGSPSRHASTMLGRSPCDFTFSRISTRTNPGAPIETSAAFRMGRAEASLRFYDAGRHL